MSNKMPTLPNEEHCTGCRVCRDVCPTSAITMKKDKHGFYYPDINLNKCVSCKKCERVCPICNVPKAYNDVEQAYVGVHKNQSIISRSASGGAFAAVVSSWDTDAVCGVRWDGFNAVNDIGYTNEEIKRFSKSKYILSDTNEIYQKALNALKKGLRVVFSGTPCQVAAFRNYIGATNFDNLLLVDIVCHGAPSAFMLQKYIEELEQSTGKKIREVSFFDKSKNREIKNKRTGRIHFCDGTSMHINETSSAFLSLYYNRLSYRRSCGNCIFAKAERVSDITLGDAHHIDKLYSDLSIDDGVSEILIHSYKGCSLFNKLDNNMKLRAIEYNWAVQYNQMLRVPTAIHPNTLKFFKMIDEGQSFEYAVKTATRRSIISGALRKARCFINCK